MTKDEFIKVYWRQYLLFEKEFLNTSDYVSIAQDNYSTFSNQYLKLLLAVCSEMDSIAEVLCKEKMNEVPYGINNKLNNLTECFPSIKEYRVNTKYPYAIKNIKPLIKFSKSSTSDWWQAYNDIKHRRNDKNESGRYNYTKANMKNVLYALSALYILNLIVFKDLPGDISSDVLASKLFERELLI